MNCYKKETWPEGPWKTEPDEAEFVHNGVRCFLKRHDRFGTWNGYVECPPDVDADELRVHGGITWDQHSLPWHTKDGDVRYIGFDCIHAWDWSPVLDYSMRAELADNNLLKPKMPDELHHIYRTYEYAKAQACRLAEQLSSPSP